MRFIFIVVRVATLALLVLPLLKPWVEGRTTPVSHQDITLWHRGLDTAEQAPIVKSLSRWARPGTRFHWRAFGTPNTHPAVAFDTLGQQLSQGGPGVHVVADGAQLWGPAARSFQLGLAQVDLVQSKRLGWWPLGKPTPGVLVAHVSIPTIAFLGETTFASVDVGGHWEEGAPPLGTATVVARTAEGVLTTHEVALESGEGGVVNQTITLPLQLTKAGFQTLFFELVHPQARGALAHGATGVTVVHGKTQVLHLAVGPDWSLRTLRQKLKFWPNLNLLSYYILRDISSDLSIPSEKLSLVEFPAQKLFGAELANFHGVLAHNFAFEGFLSAQDSLNVAQYVRQGGRLVLQAGPLTFSKWPRELEDLSPCSNTPQWLTGTTHKWRAASSEGWAAGAGVLPHLDALQSQNTFVGCTPKEGALVLATTEKEGHPVLVAYPVGSGLVLAVLGADWHLQGGQLVDDSPEGQTRRNQFAFASDGLAAWLIEFLQRRQDGGLRPPDLAGPRIYGGDTTFLVRSRGPLNLKGRYTLGVGPRDPRPAQALSLPFLQLQALSLDSPLMARALGSPQVLTLGVPGNPVQRGAPWPVWAGTQATVETPTNGALLGALPRASSPLFWQNAGFNTPPEPVATRLPLLQQHPYLLALVLFLVGIDVVVGLWFGRPRRRS